MTSRDLNLPFSDIRSNGSLPDILWEGSCGKYLLRLQTGSYCSFTKQAPSNLPHIHNDMYEICYVTQGTGRYDHGDSRFTLQKGSLFICDPKMLHEISSHLSHDLQLVFVTMNIRSLPQSHSNTFDEDVIGHFLAGHHIHCTHQYIFTDFLPLLHNVYARSEQTQHTR